MMWQERKLHRTQKKYLMAHLPGNRREENLVIPGLKGRKLCFTGENLNLITHITNKVIALHRMTYKNDQHVEDEDVVYASSGHRLSEILIVETL